MAPAPSSWGFILTSYDIDSSAPASDRAEIYIDAPANRVWDRLADIAGWPSWNTGVEWISALIPLTAGTAFEMRASGQTVRAKLQGVQAPNILCWSSGALFVSARHLITVEDLGGRTRVIAQASYRGAWPMAMPKRAKRHIRASLLQGLQDLKAASEGKPTHRKAA